MNSSLKMVVTTSAFVWTAGSLCGQVRKQADPQQTLSIRLYNDAGVDPRTLHWATVETDRLFRSAAIQITWQQLSGATAEPVACSASDRPTHVVMRLIPKAPTSASPGALAVARPFAPTGTQVLIFCDRVELLAPFANAPLYVILGEAMAHEIGHVLLGSVEHSIGGLMEAHWSTTSLHLASKGLLAFGREEAERMNARLATFQSCGIKREIAGNHRRAK